MAMYSIIEIFDSFQGEGRLMGVPATFIRFAGCNLSCPWCDTAEQLKGKKTLMTAEEIVDKVNCKNVIFTGGEPTLYDLETICNLLDKKVGSGLRAIETNGTNEVPRCINFVACSPKPQSSYSIDFSIKVAEASRQTDYKYVADSNLTADVITTPISEKTLIYIQPEFYSGEKSVEKARELVRELRKKGFDARLGIQAHKYWGVR